MTPLTVVLIEVFGTSAYTASAKASPIAQDLYSCPREALQVAYQWRVKYDSPTDEEMKNQEQNYSNTI